MEKERIPIYRIRNGTMIRQEDEVAVESHLNVSLSDGRIIPVTCTPSYTEEMILDRRFLMGDLTREELEGLELKESADALQEIHLRDIFKIAGEMFENPGTLFQDTGCAHSCVLARGAQVLCSMEDISRHNALDKIVGYALKNHISIPECAVFTSGRISEDYLRKVIDAGFRVGVSRAAVTGSAVALAKREGITLLGFIRKGGGNIYHIGTVNVVGE